MKTIYLYKHLFGLLLLSLSLCISNTAYTQTETNQNLMYIRAEIKGMACPFCSYGLEKKLRQTEGVNEVEIEFSQGIAYITTQKDTGLTEENLKKVILDSGFTVGRVEYSNKPFPRKKNNTR